MVKGELETITKPAAERAIILDIKKKLNGTPYNPFSKVLVVIFIVWQKIMIPKVFHCPKDY